MNKNPSKIIFCQISFRGNSLHDYGPDMMTADDYDISDYLLHRSVKSQGKTVTQSYSSKSSKETNEKANEGKLLKIYVKNVEVVPTEAPPCDTTTAAYKNDNQQYIPYNQYNQNQYNQYNQDYTGTNDNNYGYYDYNNMFSYDDDSNQLNQNLDTGYENSELFSSDDVVNSESIHNESKKPVKQKESKLSKKQKEANMQKAMQIAKMIELLDTIKK